MYCHPNRVSDSENPLGEKKTFSTGRTQWEEREKVQYGKTYFATCSTLHAHGRHEPDSLDFGPCLLRSAPPAKFARIEIGGVVFGEDFPLRHVGRLSECR